MTVLAPLTAVQDADKDLDQFYRAEMPGLMRFLVFRGASVADAADAAQQAFVEVCQRWARVRVMDNPSGYLRRIAGNVWTWQNRRRTQDIARAVDACWIDLSAVEDVYGRQDIKIVLDSLAMLPARQRQVMAWLYDGYRPDEIATELAMKASTVRSTIRHAKEKLRSLGVGTEER